MLENTFVHAPGIGPATERKLWGQGARCWDDFLSLHGQGRLKGAKLDGVAEVVRESRVALFARDSAFFAQRLPGGEAWRLFDDFADSAAFVDIETTGLDLFDDITVVGLFDGRDYRAFVRGRDLHEFPAVASRFRLLVTFNGAQFDLPRLQAAFPGFSPPAHLDLRFPLARLGYRGGLKLIEREAGLARPDEVQGLDGFEAVLLWRRHCAGDRGALPLLLEYVRQDVQNLLPLARLVSTRLPASLGLVREDERRAG